MVRSTPVPSPLDLPATDRVEEAGTAPAQEQPPTSHDVENIKDEELENFIQKRGVVFAKTDFQGVLKTPYVKLIFERTDKAEEGKYQIYVGEKENQQTLPWEGKTVEPGYFFIELPAGSYRISSISIPVGSTTAMEEVNVTFDVFADRIVYMGTLNVVGIKEKIRLGGVPVIRPGFEYSVEVFNEEKQAQEAFRQRYPNMSSDITTELIKVHLRSNVDLHEAEKQESQK